MQPKHCVPDRRCGAAGWHVDQNGGGKAKNVFFLMQTEADEAGHWRDNWTKKTFFGLKMKTFQTV